MRKRLLINLSRDTKATSTNHYHTFVSSLNNTKRWSSTTAGAPSTAGGDSTSSSTEEGTFSNVLQLATSDVEPFNQNFEQMSQRVELLNKTVEDIRNGIGYEKYRALQIKSGKLPARERITALLDPGSPFLELSPLAGWKMYGKDSPPAGGIITGIGWVHSIPCMIIANDSSVKGGTYYPIAVTKHMRAQKIAAQNKIPYINLVDSGGANLPYQAEIFPDAMHFGRQFARQARHSSYRLPQIAVVMGSCTAGGAYIPCMADESILVHKTAQVFLGGPPLVLAATGEKVSAEELGGAEVHCRVSGVSDYFAKDETHALYLARRSVSGMNLPQSPLSVEEHQHVEAPLYPSTDLYGFATTNNTHPVDVRYIVSRIVDGSRFDEFKSLYGTTLVTGWASIGGHPVGIIANNGKLTTAAALKGAHFAQLCNQRGQSLVFLGNVDAVDSSQPGLGKACASMASVVATVNVPKITLVIGNFCGPAVYTMSPKQFNTRFLFCWPNAMKTLAHPNSIVDPSADLVEQLNKQGDAMYGSARCWDDCLIDPAETRSVLQMALTVASFDKKFSPAQIDPQAPQNATPVLRM